MVRGCAERSIGININFLSDLGLRLKKLDYIFILLYSYMHFKSLKAIDASFLMPKETEIHRIFKINIFYLQYISFMKK